MKKMDNKGFSLVELIVVVAIMAVLMTILTPQYLKYVEKSRAQKDLSAAEEIRHAVEIAIADEAVYNDLGITKDSPTATIIVADDAAFVYKLGDTEDADNMILTELQSTFGKNKVDFTSTTYGGQTYTITIQYNDTTKGITVTGEFPSGS